MMGVEAWSLPDIPGNGRYKGSHIMNIESNGQGENMASESKDDRDDDKNTIHSGQFMLSRVHDHDPSPSLGDDDGPRINRLKGDSFDFRKARKETAKSYTFTSGRNTRTIDIDESLSTLFDCMTLAYSGKLTSPKWKQFRGLQLTIKDKIRLNNLIWREWCMQYVHGKNSVVCQFAPPLSDDIHSKPEAIVLEGKYWKRRLDTVTFEYKKWRRYYCNQRKYNRRRNVDMSELLNKIGTVTKSTASQQQSSTDIYLNSTDFMDMDLEDELFNQLNHSSFTFPNPREFSSFGISSLLQPGLIPLQPNLDETDALMDFEELLQQTNTGRSGNSVVQFTGSTSSNSQKVYPADDFDIGTGSSSMSSLRALLQPTSAPTPPPQKMVPHTPLIQSSPDPQLISPIPSPAQSPLPPQPDQASATPGGNNAMVDLINLLRMAQQSPENNGQLVSLLATQLLETQATSCQTNETLLQMQQFQQQQQLIQQQHQQQQQQQQQQQLMQLLQQTQQPQQLPMQQQPATQQTFSLQNNQQQILQQQQKQQQQQQEHLFRVQQQQLHQPQRLQHPVEVKQQTLSAIKTTKSEKQPNQTTSPLQAALLSGLKSKVTSRAASKSAATATATASPQSTIGKVNKSATPKSGGEFAVPKTKVMRMKTRQGQTPLLPKTSSTTAVSNTLTPSQQNTYLAQLLTKGTYPGAVIKVEKDATLSSPAVPSLAMPSLSQLQPIRPQESLAAPCTPTQTITISVQETSDLSSGISLFGSSSTITSKSSDDLSLDCTVSASLKSSPASMVADSSSILETSNLDMGSPISDTEGIDSPRGRHSSGDGGGTRRVSHTSAEQKRRCNIKNGFDVLHSLIPALSQNPNAKVSKAAMLQKTADYCKKLKSERAQMQKEAEILKQEIESLNQSISQCQSQLPATGVPVTRQRADRMKEMFEEYVKTRTLENWKFWIFSIMVKPLFEAYNNMVSTASVDEMCRTTMAWLDQHCSLVSLRPTVLNALRQLSTSTNILTDPARLPEQATEAVIKSQKSSKS